MRVSDQEPKPRIRKAARMAAPSRRKAPGPPRSKEREEAFPQTTRLVLSAQALAYLKAVSERTGLAQRYIVDRLILEAQTVERKIHAMGFEHVGEALAVLKDRRGR